MVSQDNNKEEPTEASALLHGDILDTLTWHRSVFSSLRSINPIKPWLIIHRADNVDLTSHAYDPRSHVWLHIKPDLMKSACYNNAAIRSSNSAFLYAISSSEFSFSSDPLHLNWTRVSPPKVWRVDPVVAKVWSFVVVAGGGYDFEDDPMAVEMYDVKSQSWCDGCESSLCLNPQLRLRGYPSRLMIPNFW